MSNMIKIENRLIQKLDVGTMSMDTSVHISDCIIEQLDFVGLELENEIIIEKCIIKNMKIHSCWFVGGFSLKNNIVFSEVDYQMGGHNKAQILIDGNIFNGFFSFFDCHFEKLLTITNNIFVADCDLFVLEGKSFDNRYEEGYIVQDNIGRLDVMRAL